MTENKQRQLQKHDVYSLLSNGTRITTLEILEEADGPISMEDLAEIVANREQTNPIKAQISLQHNHMPKLEEYDVVQMNDNQIFKSDQFDDVAAYL